jgi:pyruvate/oxaloacetate carboxyltransferase
LVEVSGKTPAEVRDFLSTKNQGEKIALRRSDKLRPTIEKLEAEKAKNSKSAVDTDALLGDLGIGGSAKKAKSE